MRFFLFLFFLLSVSLNAFDGRLIYTAKENKISWEIRHHIAGDRTRTEFWADGKHFQTIIVNDIGAYLIDEFKKSWQPADSTQVLLSMRRIYDAAENNKSLRVPPPESVKLPSAGKSVTIAGIQGAEYVFDEKHAKFTLWAARDKGRFPVQSLAAFSPFEHSLPLLDRFFRETGTVPIRIVQRGWRGIKFELVLQSATEERLDPRLFVLAEGYTLETTRPRFGS